MNESSRSALIFLIEAFVHLYVLILLLRLMLPWLKVSFNNPLTQGILRVTSPVVLPLRRILPPVGRIDTATLVVAYAIEYLLTMIVVLIVSYPLMILPLAITAAVRLLVLSIYLYVFAIIIRVVLSWTGSGHYNPAMDIVESLARPVMRPFSRYIPPLGGLNFSAFFAIVFLIALTILLNGLKMYPTPL